MLSLFRCPKVDLALWDIQKDPRYRGPPDFFEQMWKLAIILFFISQRRYQPFFSHASTGLYRGESCRTWVHGTSFHPCLVANETLLFPLVAFSSLLMTLVLNLRHWSQFTYREAYGLKLLWMGQLWRMRHYLCFRWFCFHLLANKLYCAHQTLALALGLVHFYC